MKFHLTAITFTVALLGSAVLTTAAVAQTSETAPAPAATGRTEQVLQRNVKQETRIRDGLQSGQLNTREAALLQREEAHVDQMQANALKDGRMTPAEAARVNRAQNKVSADIRRADNNGVNGNPLSASSQRMQAATQRDINQQTRVANGVAQGQLTNRETARLEAGQARTDRQQARAGRDGHVGAGEAAAVNATQNRQSGRIHGLRHNAAQRAS
jgi:hypothetical protein